jgi:hypothetical protein
LARLIPSPEPIKQGDRARLCGIFFSFHSSQRLSQTVGPSRRTAAEFKVGQTSASRLRTSHLASSSTGDTLKARTTAISQSIGGRV